jgi:hypothetical protein
MIMLNIDCEDCCLHCASLSYELFYTSTRPYGITSQKTVIFIVTATGTSDLCISRIPEIPDSVHRSCVAISCGSGKPHYLIFCLIIAPHVFASESMSFICPWSLEFWAHTTTPAFPRMLKILKPGWKFLWGGGGTDIMVPYCCHIYIGRTCCISSVCNYWMLWFSVANREAV